MAGNRQPWFAIFALVATILTEGPTALMFLTANDSKVAELAATQLPTISDLDQQRLVIRYQGLGALTAASVCLFGLAAGALHKGGPSSAATSLIGATVYHAAVAARMKWYMPGSEDATLALRVHLGLALFSFAAVLLCHWKRWGGAVPGNLAKKVNRQGRLQRLVMIMNMLIEGAVPVITFGMVLPLLVSLHKVIARGVPLDTAGGMLAMVVYTTAASCVFGTNLAGVAAGVTGGSVADAIGPVLGSTVFHAALVTIWLTDGAKAGLTPQDSEEWVPYFCHGGFALLGVVATAMAAHGSGAASKSAKARQ